MAYYDFLNIVFAPLLKLPTLLAILVLAFLVSILIILITKYTTDQSLMKKLKDDIKEHQKQIKELKENPAKAMELQKKSMELNMKYMTHSLKPTIITFIPIILIFSWMSATFAFESIKPQQEFSVTAVFGQNANGNADLVVPEGMTIIGNKTKKIENGKAEWALKGEEGEHLLEFLYNDEKQQHSVLITKNKKYISPTKKTDSAIKLIQTNYKKLIVLPIGYKDWLGWLGTYIWSSIIFTMILRKLMKVY
ncbi:DUF106 domain-containing protein [Candidatus Woesearchaeota archaeon]|nr:DUF106 domain-containing protein [Candidatus Woesearchaeota archaeon]